MMARKHTVGARRRWVVDYSEWLDEGNHVITASVVSSSLTATVDTVSIDPDGRVIFFVNGGVLNELFTATVTVSDTKTQTKVDALNFVVVAP